MTPDSPSSIQTRPSLLRRLQEGDDLEGWQEFYRVYGKLVRDFALQAGLNNTEADEVVQETAIGLARHLPAFRYDPKVCRFKTWLLNLASWRIKDQLKKRNRLAGCESATTAAPPPVRPSETASDTATIDRLADPATADLAVVFETEWRKNLFTAALERVKEKFSLEHFQVFDLLVVKEWPAADVARALGISLANVYVTRHRVAAAVKKEARRLEQQFERAARERSEADPPKLDA